MNGTYDPNGPITALQQMGIQPKWVREEYLTTRNGKPAWAYLPTWIPEDAIQDLARLTLEGWNVRIFARDRKTVRIYIRPNKENS